MAWEHAFAFAAAHAMLDAGSLAHTDNALYYCVSGCQLLLSFGTKDIQNRRCKKEHKTVLVSLRQEISSSTN